MISDMKLDIRLLQCNDIQIFDDEFLICGSEQQTKCIIETFALFGQEYHALMKKLLYCEKL